MTDSEIIEAMARRIARDRYKFDCKGEPLPDKERDGYADSDWPEFVKQAESALAVARPMIERELFGGVENSHD